MSYSTSTPPVQIASAFGGGPALWVYTSDDLHTDVDASGYFTNGSALGMKVNDVVMCVRTTTSPGVTMHHVSAVTAGGAATIGSAILA